MKELFSALLAICMVIHSEVMVNLCEDIEADESETGESVCESEEWEDQSQTPSESQSELRSPECPLEEELEIVKEILELPDIDETLSEIASKNADDGDVESTFSEESSLFYVDDATLAEKLILDPRSSGPALPMTRAELHAEMIAEFEKENPPSLNRVECSMLSLFAKLPQAQDSSNSYQNTSYLSSC